MAILHTKQIELMKAEHPIAAARVESSGPVNPLDGGISDSP